MKKLSSKIFQKKNQNSLEKLKNKMTKLLIPKVEETPVANNNTNFAFGI